MKSFKKMQLLLMLVLMFLNIPLMAAVRAGSVLDVAGEVSQLKNERGAKILPLKLNDDLLFNDSVMTGDASSTRLLLSPDEKRIRFYVHENSNLKIDPVLIKDGKKNFVTRFSKGLLRVIAEKLEGDTVTIITPNATVGIRGTTIDVATDIQDGTVFTTVAVQSFLGAPYAETAKVLLFLLDRPVPVPVDYGMAVTVTTSPSGTTVTPPTPTAAAGSAISDLSQLKDDKVASFDYFDILRGRVENQTALNTLDFSRAIGGTSVTTCSCTIFSDPTCAPPAQFQCRTD
jgi:hypothetical protein